MLGHIVATGAGRLLYVSCHPGTMARDAGILCREYGFKLATAGAMDMFVQDVDMNSLLRSTVATASGLVIPDTAKEKPLEGKVIAVGSGKFDEAGEALKSAEEEAEALAEQREIQKRQDEMNMQLNLHDEESVGEKKVARNEPCPCGSGKKFKQCHGKK